MNIPTSLTMDILVSMEAENIIEKLKILNETQRMAFFNKVCEKYCVRCGRELINGSCYCDNDGIVDDG